MNFSGIILEWYKKNRRELPWRLTSDPYCIWISEVILQQTRIFQGLGYYIKFMEAFPDVETLAAAGEDEVLKLWQGLGYYSRARNLHQSAKDIVGKMGGTFPGSYKELLKLKGVGTYTASAIASICFGEPYAVVDGNVSRVIARLCGVEEAINSSTGSRIITSLADRLMKEACTDPGTHNQAMMEFGALQCVPVSPVCGECPLETRCVARLSGRVENLPVKNSGKRPAERWMYFYICVCDGVTILTRRDGNDIWKSLYQFPLVETGNLLDEMQLTGIRLDEVLGIETQDTPAGTDIRVEQISESIRHQLTHRTIHARFIHVRMKKLPHPLPAKWIVIPLEELENYPVPRLIHRYMESSKFSYLVNRNNEHNLCL
ncbi:MAG: A/G-specific adenine glycosylase [Bacteroidota bacterium]